MHAVSANKLNNVNRQKEGVGWEKRLLPLLKDTYAHTLLDTRNSTEQMGNWVLLWLGFQRTSY